MKPSLMFNAIVRNESARLERCLKSVLPHVKAVCILDTGSTDGTPDLIRRIALEHEVACVVHTGTFVDFSQARNDAFHIARAANGISLPWCQFALLMDADMELVVDDKMAFSRLDATAPSYDMMQKGGAVSYANRRLVNLNVSKPPYVGVTHEYIDVVSAGMIAGARFVDHADGANRANKYERDALLLEEALKSEPNNARYWYYLGNTYRDWGKPHEATDAYEHRIMLGGWDEETHSAMMNLACSLKDADHPDGFVSKMIEAYNFRPQRAEPLYDLAKYYREKGDNAAALLFATAGVNMKRPNDVLFVNDFVYDHGLRYEYSIAAFYNEAERPRAFEITNALALDPTAPSEYRWSARSNLFWFTKPLKEWCPSFEATKLDFVAPHGYTAMNPSLETTNSIVVCNIRCVNYKIDEHGAYVIHGGGDAIDTRNFVVRLQPDTLETHNAAEIIWDRPAPQFILVTGLEDIRLWRYSGELHFSATVREQSARGTCQIMTGKLVYDKRDPRYITATDTRIISGDVQHEKNWMPTPNAPGGHPRFMYRLDRVITEEGIEEKHPAKFHVGDISGSSQLIPFKAGYLAVVHEAGNAPSTGKRTYWHRFVWFDSHCVLRRISLPFVFFDRQIEFCAGLSAHPNLRQLMISFGVRDAEAWVAKIDIEDVARMLVEER